MDAPFTDNARKHFDKMKRINTNQGAIRFVRCYPLLKLRIWQELIKYTEHKGNTLN